MFYPFSPLKFSMFAVIINYVLIVRNMKMTLFNRIDGILRVFR